MQRSFTDRVLGGVCGGMGESLSLNAWWLRALFVILALVTVGAFVVPYLLLWWIVPMQSPLERRRRRVGGFLVLLFLALALAAWAARQQGLYIAPNGTDLFWPVMLLILSLVFFLRQLGR